jgi:phosphoribosylformimino-5-aminoimidazole carboxamide ribotide isomerase
VPLTIYPAIDLKAGACVRLRRGDMADATIYSQDPAAQAEIWQAAGCRWLHVVDLDGAFAGKSVNRAAVQAILAASRVPVQLGGGVRDMAGITAWLDAGIARVILGSAAVKTPALVREAAREFPGRVVVGIDARHGQVATEGWAEATALTGIEVARRFEQDGVAAIIYTEISRDGMLGGVDTAGTLALAQAVQIPVIASGGIGEAAHLRSLVAEGGSILEGVILGRALYDGRLTLTEALRIAAV